VVLVKRGVLLLVEGQMGSRVGPLQRMVMQQQQQQETAVVQPIGVVAVGAAQATATHTTSSSSMWSPLSTSSQQVVWRRRMRSMNLRAPPHML
jgi:hypothetical protein